MDDKDHDAKEIDFPRYNMKCSEENVISRGIFHVVSRFPLHFILYRGNFDRLTMMQRITMAKNCDLRTSNVRSIVGHR